MPTYNGSPSRCLAVALCCLLGSAGQAANATPAGDSRIPLVLDLQGFTEPVTGVCFSPDDVHVAACGGKEVRIWDLPTGQLHHTLRGQIDDHSYGDCLAVAFSPDNCHLVVGISNHGELGSLRVYDTHDLTEIKELLPGHRLPVTRLAFSRDSRYLATADTSGTISIFDWPLRSIVATAKPADHAQGKYTAFDFPTGESFLVVRGQAASAAVIAVPSSKILEDRRRLPPALVQWLEMQTAPEVLRAATGLRVRLDREAWLACGPAKAGAAESHWVVCGNVNSAEPTVAYRGHQREVTALALSPGCGWAATGDRGGAIHVWDTGTSQPRYVFRDLGLPCYRAGLDLPSRRIGFTNQPLQGKQWGHNSFGRIDRTFDWGHRRIAALQPNEVFPRETIQRGDSRLALTYEKERFGMQVAAKGASTAFSLTQAASPACYSLLTHQQMGSANPVVVGDERGGLVGYDPLTRQPLRHFVGHRGFVTSLSESADGSLLTTSSTDRTIRVWSLGSQSAAPSLGFQLAGDIVSAVPAKGPAERAGIRAGDRLITVSGKLLSEITALQAGGEFPYKVGQRVLLGLERGRVGYQTEISLVAGPDSVEPVLTMLVTARHEWILWTPEGYYDASPGAGDLVGFHVNRGPQHSARFLPLHQFRRQLYRPDIIDQVFQSSSVAEAVVAANATLPAAPDAIDLRQAEAMTSQSPPQIRILSPQPGAITKEGQVHVLAEIVSPDNNPIGDVRLLVNGRPGGQKGAAILSGEGEQKSRLSLSQAVTLLPGENTISLIASNRRATSVPATVTVTYEAPPEEQNRQPKLHLLSIGVSEYANQRFNLRFAHLDARDFAGSWDTQRGRLYRDVATTLLVNQDASAERVRAAMNELLAAVDRHDVAVIFISAHGVRDSQLEYYLGTHEIDPKNLSETGVHFSAVTQLLEQLPCKVLMFVDTCHSAGITGAKSISGDPLYELSSDEYGAIVFASSMSREISLEDEAWGHGAFTKSILETFADQASDLNGDGYLSLTELEQRVYDQVQSLTDGLQHPVMSRPATVPNLRFYQLAQPVPLATR